MLLFKLLESNLLNILMNKIILIYSFHKSIRKDITDLIVRVHQLFKIFYLLEFINEYLIKDIIIYMHTSTKANQHHIYKLLQELILFYSFSTMP